MNQALSGTEIVPHVLHLRMYRVYFFLQASIMSETQHPVPSPGKSAPYFDVWYGDRKPRSKSFLCQMHRGSWKWESGNHIFRQKTQYGRSPGLSVAGGVENKNLIITCFAESKMHSESWKGKELMMLRFMLPKGKVVPSLECKHSV